MKKTVFFIFITIPSFLFGMAEYHPLIPYRWFVITNESTHTFKITFRRPDPGFRGQDVLVDDEIVLHQQVWVRIMLPLVKGWDTLKIIHMHDEDEKLREDVCWRLIPPRDKGKLIIQGMGKGFLCDAE